MMLTGSMREYIINAKKLLLESIVRVDNGLGFLPSIWYAARILRDCMKYPEATIENTSEPGTLILIGIKDKFFKRFKLSTRKVVFKVAFRLLIGTRAHDPFESDLLDWFVWEIKKSDWPPRIAGRPQLPYWIEAEE